MIASIRPARTCPRCEERLIAETLRKDERFTVARRIEAVDRAIYALVYALYGLTDDEIAIVEGAA